MPSDERLDESSQNATLIVSLRTDAGAAVDVDSVCERLLTEFPGAAITAQNSFAAKRAFLEGFRQHSQERLSQGGALETWAWKSMDELNDGFDGLIADNRRAELRSGPKKDLAIPLSNETQLVGQVGAKSILFRGQCRQSDETVMRLAQVLESLGIGKVEIMVYDPPPS